MKYYIEIDERDIDRFRIDNPCKGSHGHCVLVLTDKYNMTIGFELLKERQHGEGGNGMSMTIREVIHKLMEAKDLDKECVIEVSRSVFDNTDDDTVWVDVNIEKIVDCNWGCAIEGKEG